MQVVVWGLACWLIRTLAQHDIDSVTNRPEGLSVQAPPPFVPQLASVGSTQTRSQPDEQGRAVTDSNDRRIKRFRVVVLDF